MRGVHPTRNAWSAFDRDHKISEAEITFCSDLLCYSQFVKMEIVQKKTKKKQQTNTHTKKKN